MGFIGLDIVFNRPYNIYMNINIAKEARRGGLAVRKKYGANYFKLLSAKGKKKRRENAEKRKLALLN